MPHCVTISIRKEDQWVIDEIRKLGIGMSRTMVEGAKLMLGEIGVTNTNPPSDWDTCFVKGKDYSYLTPQERQSIPKKFGYYEFCPICDIVVETGTITCPQCADVRHIIGNS